MRVCSEAVLFKGCLQHSLGSFLRCLIPGGAQRDTRSEFFSTVLLPLRIKTEVPFVRCITPADTIQEPSFTSVIRAEYPEEGRSTNIAAIVWGRLLGQVATSRYLDLEGRGKMPFFGVALLAQKGIRACALLSVDGAAASVSVCTLSMGRWKRARARVKCADRGLAWA